jgi:aquaporin NIP
MRAKTISEFCATFIMVFIGTLAIVANNEGLISIGLAGISIVFGALIFLMIFIFGPISGAHINPAVTVSLYLNKSIQKTLVLPYLLAQLTGAFCASLLVQMIFPAAIGLGETTHASTIYETIGIEFILSFILMFLIIQLTNYKYQGTIIALYIMITIYFFGECSGASLNPTRSLSPALVSGNVKDLWIYLTVPFIGGFAAVFLCKKLQYLQKRQN